MTRRYYIEGSFTHTRYCITVFDGSRHSKQKCVIEYYSNQVWHSTDIVVELVCDAKARIQKLDAMVWEYETFPTIAA